MKMRENSVNSRVKTITRKYRLNNLRLIIISKITIAKMKSRQKATIQYFFIVIYCL